MATRKTKPKKRRVTAVARTSKKVAVECVLDLQYAGVYHEAGDAIQVSQEDLDQNPQLFRLPMAKAEPSAKQRHAASRTAAREFARHGSGRLRRE